MDKHAETQPPSAVETPGEWRGPDTSTFIPISEIGPEFRPQIKRHLLGLDPHDRYLRFGYIANDEQIARYVDGIDFERDQIYAIFDHDLKMLAMAHLAYGSTPEQPAAEFGVSVAKKARGCGLGKRLFERAAVHAVNSGVDTLYIYALTENATMLHIARRAGAVIESSGGESAAHVKLPPATFRTHLTELMAGQVGTMDFMMKSGTAALHGLLTPKLKGLPRRTRKPASPKV
jgi:RimJ/RimL family protein N-acetyltransferase